MAEAAQFEDLFTHGVNAWFFKTTTVEELVRSIPPLESVEDLALDDLTPEQAESFLRAIEE
jgi:hypothetical protein